MRISGLVASIILISGGLVLAPSAPASAANVPDHFSDTFDRADGGLGADWQSPYGLPTISGNRATSYGDTFDMAWLSSFSARGPVMVSADVTSSATAHGGVNLMAAFDGADRVDATIGDWDGDGTFDHLRLLDGSTLSTEVEIPPLTAGHIELRVANGQVTFTSYEPSTGLTSTVSGTTTRSGTNVGMAVTDNATIDNFTAISSPDAPHIGDTEGSIRPGTRSVTVWVNEWDDYDFTYDTGGSPVTAWKVWAVGSDNSTSPAVTIDPCGACWVTLNGLTPGMTYQFRTQATNAAGSGPLGYGPSFTPNGDISAPDTVGVSGTPKVGVALRAVPGTWTPTPITFGYQWFADGVAIAGATAATFTPVAAQLGKTISVQVTGLKSGHDSVVRTSASTAKVARGTITAATPRITGKAKVGYQLTAIPGTWKPSGVTLTFQWLANGKAIAGAQGRTWTVPVSARRKRISVKVTATMAGYTTATKTSTSTRAVKK